MIGYVCPEGNNANSSYCLSEVHSSAKVRQTFIAAVFVSSTLMTRMVQWWESVPQGSDLRQDPKIYWERSSAPLSQADDDGFRMLAHESQWSNWLVAPYIKLVR